MKFRLFILGALALVLASSCQRDGQDSTRDDIIGIRVQGDVTTKSSDSSMEKELLFNIPVKMDNGETWGLTAFLSDYDDNEPETKGYAITTANIGPKLGSFQTSVFKDGATYVDSQGLNMGNVTVAYQSDGSWELVGGLYHWPANGDDITFCSLAPSTVTGRTNVNWHNGESLSFSYSLPTPSSGTGPNGYTDAASQPDIVFAMDTQNLNSRVKSDGKSYADIHFKHALTAVRFTRGTIEDCTIQTIALKGFYGNGTATGTLDSDGNLSAFTWTTSGSTYNYTQTFNKVLDDTVPHQNPDSKQVTGGSLDPSTDQSYTFMMIPQLLATGASIEIYIKERIHPIIVDLTGANDGSGHPIDSKLKDWRTYAGKVITISLNSVFEGEHVDIEITDQVNANVKTNATVTNTAEVGKDCYVRVAIVANWVKADGTVIYPYPIDNIATDSRFTGFDSSKWVFDNGFYYYKYKLVKGESVKLFDKFTAPVSGNSDYPTTIPDIDHLVVTIVAQGVDWEKKAEMIGTYGWPDVFLN